MSPSRHSSGVGKTLPGSGARRKVAWAEGRQDK
jgi:hypothetical protein